MAHNLGACLPRRLPSFTASHTSSRMIKKAKTRKHTIGAGQVAQRRDMRISVDEFCPAHADILAITVEEYENWQYSPSGWFVLSRIWYCCGRHLWCSVP
ncbi:hypothetical protein P8C59_007487 [Phyllachora maydis]|uniref:Uncharacterized protein n=1 Tax=Phyllachora maydis TaxID=1825666 RepID=A0AAD9I8J3_9PEZI|nr:hypothetical protein P8C59_007487 [Phyllachora maydis]